MSTLAAKWVDMPRHPEDPDELPATVAWRQLVMSIVDADGAEMTRSRLARKCGTTSSQILKLLNGTTKSSPLVRKINKVLRIPYVEPQPVSQEMQEIIDLVLRVDNVAWLHQTLEMAAGVKKH